MIPTHYKSQSPDVRSSRLRRAGIHVLKVVCHGTVHAEDSRHFSDVHKAGDVVAEWESQNGCYVSNSPLAPGRPVTEGVPRFRVQSLPHLVYPSAKRVALFLVDLS